MHCLSASSKTHNTLIRYAMRQIGSYEDSLAFIRDNVKMTDEQREWVLRRTAEKVYFEGHGLADDSKVWMQDMPNL